MSLPDWLLSWLSSDYLPWILFAGALGDALIGLNVAIHGELFFLAGGMALATASGSITAALPLLLSLWLGAWSGDMVSYGLGRRLGPGIVNSRLFHSAKMRGQISRGQSLIQRHGCKALIIARLSGPLSWVMPSLAGISQLTFRRFASASLAGVIIGSAQFIAIGYAMGAGIDFFPVLNNYWSEYGYLAITVGLIIAACSWCLWRYHQRQQWFRAVIICMGITLSGLTLMNLGYFFAGTAHAKQPQISLKSLTTHDITRFDYQVYAGFESHHKPQPINLVLITRQSLTDVHAAMGWRQNLTYSSAPVSLTQYISSLRGGTPPVSDLYWQGYPQNAAFQPATGGDLVNRAHVRWWHAGFQPDGTTVYLGAVSQDNELEIKAYKGIVTLLHDIDANVDSSRDHFAAQLQAALPTASLSQEAWGPVLSPEDESQDYYSDGQVAVLRL